MDIEGDSWLSAFGPEVGLDYSACSWVEPLARNVERLVSLNGYEGRQDAMTVEAYVGLS